MSKLHRNPANEKGDDSVLSRAGPNSFTNQSHRLNLSQGRARCLKPKVFSVVGQHHGSDFKDINLNCSENYRLSKKINSAVFIYLSSCYLDCCFFLKKKASK